MMEALILVAHADDETLGAGGTVVKLVRNGWKVSVVALSDGVLDVRGTIEDNRPGFEAACQLLGVHDFKLLGFKDQKLDTVPMAELANAVSSLGHEPDLIITHVDTDLNLDHRLTCDVAKIIGRPKTKPISILGCEIPNTSFWNAKVFPANYYVDVSDEVDLKIEAFAKYQNELQPYPHPWSKKGLKLLAEYHGIQCGFRFAEAFSMIRGYEGRLV
jgi:LmbE family N-acetylglucosaminyl deacetylase